ncbi:hypothetical protein [Leptospira bouyouniensis]|uniref:hypothetical protein n=1 Tax=Leptospira bouyouniensis TaxID=2484911 RepID=UPI0010917F70|nr:hypothetical protein [Leptospira bouyouniensis]TGM74777.1 hypothetical protein EHQ99_17535 [Leptospira bouyouniensis]
MKPNLIKHINHLILSITCVVILNCATFNQTKRVTKKSLGIEYFKIVEFVSVAFIEKNKILIVAKTTDLKAEDTEIYNPSQIPKERCFILDLLDEDTKVVAKHTIEKAFFYNECYYPKSKAIQFKTITKAEFVSDKMVTNKEIINIAFESRYRKDHYIQIEIKTSDKMKISTYKIGSSVQKNDKPFYLFYYSLSLPYDIFAGLLHTVGFPFIVGTVIFYKASFSNNLYEIYLFLSYPDLHDPI